MFKKYKKFFNSLIYGWSAIILIGGFTLNKDGKIMHILHEPVLSMELLVIFVMTVIFFILYLITKE